MCNQNHLLRYHHFFFFFSCFKNKLLVDYNSTELSMLPLNRTGCCVTYTKSLTVKGCNLELYISLAGYSLMSNDVKLRHIYLHNRVYFCFSSKVSKRRMLPR